ncbi:unnamed protein product [Arctogadus glacialis]
MLTRIKETVWANGPYDVGHTPQHNIVVNVKNPHRPEWRHQYTIKPDAEEGINDTITGLLEAEDRRGAQWHHLSRCRIADTPGRSWTETLTDLAALQAKDKHSSSQDDGPQRAPGKVPGRIPSGSPVPRRSGRQHRQIPTA